LTSLKDILRISPQNVISALHHSTVVILRRPHLLFL
jgi:hypothetical protein